MSSFWDASIRLDLLLSETIGEMKMAEADKPKARNLLLLAGVLNAANREADDEAGALIARVRKNHRRTLGLIAKAHGSESLKEQTLSQAETEQANSDLAAAIGDNGAPLDDEADEKVREELKAAKSPKSSDGSPAVGQTDQGTFQEQ